MIRNLVVIPARALDEINSEYSTMTEVADVLLRHADVPFRTAHHYASELTGYGRAAGKSPQQLTDAELEAVYEEAIGSPLPVDVALIREAMDPAAMVANRRGTGGPQPAETERMLAEHRRQLDGHADWLERTTQSLVDARRTLDREFRGLIAR